MSLTSAGSSSVLSALKLSLLYSAAFSVVNVSLTGCWKPYLYSRFMAYPVVLAKLLPNRFSLVAYGI